MKAVLARSIPPGRVVDLAHDLPAHAVGEAAFVVRAMAVGFPAGTVHVVVVDPGVGGHRQPIVVACQDGSYLVGPDNGVLAPLADTLGVAAVRRIDRRMAPRVGTTFDGRDVFTPAAAHLATGGRLHDLGPPAEMRGLTLPLARRAGNELRGEVLHVDHFGNLVSNVPTEWVPSGTHALQVRIGRSRFVRLPRSSSYEALGPGRPGILGSSFGTLELAVAEGRAADRFRARAGTPLRFRGTARRARRVNA